MARSSVRDSPSQLPEPPEGAAFGDPGCEPRAIRAPGHPSIESSRHGAIRLRPAFLRGGRSQLNEEQYR